MKKKKKKKSDEIFVREMDDPVQETKTGSKEALGGRHLVEKMSLRRFQAASRVDQKMPAEPVQTAATRAIPTGESYTLTREDPASRT